MSSGRRTFWPILEPKCYTHFISTTYQPDTLEQVGRKAGVNFFLFKEKMNCGKIAMSQHHLRHSKSIPATSVEIFKCHHPSSLQEWWLLGFWYKDSPVIGNFVIDNPEPSQTYFRLRLFRASGRAQEPRKWHITVFGTRQQVTSLSWDRILYKVCIIY